MENKPNSIALLLSMGCKLIYNNKGHSAIDYAIYYKFPEAASAMVTHEQRDAEILALKSQKYSCVILALIASMPRVFEAVLDKAITKANCKKDSKEFYVVQHTRLERKLPKLFLQRVNKIRLIEYPNVIKGKLGFLESAFKKWFFNQFPDSCPDSGSEANEDMLPEMLGKQKRQLHEISNLLDRQHHLIRLIVQKMEIKTEEDDVDEGPAPSETRHPQEPTSKWNSPRIRSKLQAAIAFGKIQST
ncbi:hypothetical protein J437_LFUL004789 [Ladona fulva]|uniref:Uncharacterized protein n=1 Tax=Ladona fulva TaxID=123851 RepID=A0A8K0NZR0_LADFU|nr:hypothetical protein J437_LFUL004789 [Ladona fulva]